MEFKLYMLGAGEGTIWEGFLEWEGSDHASKEEWWHGPQALEGAGVAPDLRYFLEG